MASNDEEIRVAITAQADQYNAAMAQVSADTEAMGSKVAEEAAAFNAAQQAKFDALMRLSTAFKASLSSNAELSEAESALDQAMAAGALSAQEYATHVAQLDAAETAMAASATAATEAVAANTAALTLNGGVAREVGVLISELARGNYTRLEGSTITLANRTGLLSKALAFVLSPAGAVAAALAAAGVAAVKGAEDLAQFENVVQLTNGAVGMSAGELQTMADNISHATKDSSDAAMAVQRLGASGRFAGDELNQAATSAVQFAQATGMKIEQVTSLLIKMATNPKAPLDELTNSLHVLSAAQAQEVEDLIRTGDKAGAAALEIQAFAARAQQAESQVASQTNGLVGYFKNLGHQIAEAGHDFAELMNVSTGGGDAAAKLAVINRQISAIHSNVMLLNPGMALQLPILEHQRAELEQQVNLQKQQEQQAAATTKQLKGMVPALGSFVAIQKEGLKGIDLSGNLKQQLAEMVDATNTSYQDMEGLSREYWGYVLQNTKDGTAAHIEALQEVDQIQKRSDEEMERSVEQQATAAKEAARKVAEAQRKAAEARRQANALTMNELGEERAATQANTAARIQADAAILASATRLYGAMSSEQRHAMGQMIADGRAYDTAVLQQRESELDVQLKVDEAAVAEKRKAAQQQLSEREITVSQALAIEEAANQEALNDYAQYLAAKVALDQGNVKALNKDAQDWVAFQKQTTKQMASDQTAASKQLQQQWMQTLRPITQAFDQSITGMIQGTKTLSQTWHSLMADLLMSEVRAGSQRLAEWVSTEMAKKDASAGSTQAIVAIQAAGAAESKTIDATTGKSQISTAAATGAAKAYQATVGIPYVGPILAPIAAAVAFAGIEAFGGSISSASGGWDRVPVDDAPALLHRNEMVLPANLADRVRGMTDQGGAGGDVHHHHYNIQAWDSRSMRDTLRRNPHLLADAATHAKRKGY